MLLQAFSFRFTVSALLLTCSVANQGTSSLWNRYRCSLQNYFKQLPQLQFHRTRLSLQLSHWNASLSPLLFWWKAEHPLYQAYEAPKQMRTHAVHTDTRLLQSALQKHNTSNSIAKLPVLNKSFKTTQTPEYSVRRKKIVCLKQNKMIEHKWVDVQTGYFWNLRSCAVQKLCTCRCSMSDLEL